MSDPILRLDRYDEDFSGLYVDPDGAYCLYTHVEKLQRELSAKEKELAAKTAECAELRKDAERYRWLRKNWVNKGGNIQPCLQWFLPITSIGTIEERLDEQIDAAMKGE